ncbi:MAG: hypothetical protein RLO12_01070, partial [Fulvivirga sp.]
CNKSTDRSSHLVSAGTPSLGSIPDFPIFKLINQFLGIVIGREAKGYAQYRNPKWLNCKR